MPFPCPGQPLRVVTYRHGTHTSGHYLDMIAEGLAPSWITPSVHAGRSFPWFAYGRRFGVTCHADGRCEAIAPPYQHHGTRSLPAGQAAKRARSDAAFQLFIRTSLKALPSKTPSPLTSE